MAMGRARRLGAVVALAGLLAATGCGGSDEEAAAGDLPFKVIKPGHLTVTYSESYLPKIASGDGGKLEGYEGFLIGKVAEKYGLKLQPMPTEFASQILSVQQGRADVGTGIYYTEERAKQVFYTRPNITDRLGALTLKSTKYDNVDSLKGKPIASVNGFSYNSYLFDYYGKENVKLFPSYAEASQAVLGGQVVAFMGSTGTAPGIIRSHPDLTLQTFADGDFSLPENVAKSATYEYVNCKNPGLADAIDQVYQELVSSGEWQKQLDQWQVGGAEYTPPAERPTQHCA
ncbi:amino acid ABC transporter substrate-binding protein [Sphaerisporangium krabiense]|nr:amino acid ABC transporter substrate-binding protein [Sphaerisporangium krabiense]